MRVYSVEYETAVNTGASNTIYIANKASADCRGAVVEWTCGATTDGAGAAIFEMQAITDENASPGGTAPTATSRDPSLTATSAFNGVYNATNAPTRTAGAIYEKFGINQRASRHWVASGGRKIWIPATEDYGVDVKVTSAGTYTVVGALTWEE